jgi:hypothetical protein
MKEWRRSLRGHGMRGGLREGGDFAVLAAGGNDRAAVGMG